MTINPPPQRIPAKILADPFLKDFFNSLKNSLFTVWYRTGGKDGVPNYAVEDVPASDPGWATSSTVNMTPPDGYLKARTTDGTEIAIPYWNV